MGLQANYSRRVAVHVAALASEGYITSLVGYLPTRQWRLTEAGLRYLETEF